MRVNISSPTTFAYSNVGTETAQLVSREWIITTARRRVERVKGPGVVGEQPVLPPGGAFEYTSYCPLKTAVGSMHGTYQMVTAGEERSTLRLHLLRSPRPIRSTTTRTLKRAL